MRTLLKKFEQTFGSSVQVKNFGRSDQLMVEVDSSRVLEAAAWLRMEESFRMDFLENLSVFETKDRLYFSYFIRSLSHDRHLALRSSAAIPENSGLVEFPSIRGVWTQAEPFEAEITPLFGVRFIGFEKVRPHRRNFGEFAGFPLRKSYSWGREWGTEELP